MRTYREFLRIKKGSAIQKFLDNLDDVLIEQIGKWEILFKKNHKKEPTEYDKEYQKLVFVFDLVSSVEKYLEPTDNIITTKYHMSNKGSYIVDAKIERGSVVHDFNTEVIFAGGYNIQRLHYRYIVKTNIPMTNRDDLARQFKEKIKILKGNKKISEEIQRYEKMIENNMNRRTTDSYTDEEVLKCLREKNSDFSRIYDVTWEEIIRRGADKNYKNKQEFLEKREEFKRDAINHWLKIHTLSKEGRERRFKEFSNKITKLKSKIK